MPVGTSILFLGILFGIMTAVVSYIVWRLLQGMIWKIKVPVFKQMGKSILWDTDEKGRILKAPDGFTAVQLKSSKDKIKVPKYDVLSIGKKGQSVYPVFKTTEGQYFPVKMMKPPELELVEDSSSKNWGVQQRERIDSKFKPKESFWSKYGAMVMNIILAGVIIFLVIYMMSKFEIISNSLAFAADKISIGLQAMSGGNVVPNPSNNTAIMVP